MADMPPPKSASGTSSPRRPPRASGAKSTPGFDEWLERKLRKIFNSAAAEPLPPDLVNLLEKLDDAEKKSGK
jgi:Anti-sigma factor NepR